MVIGKLPFFSSERMLFEDFPVICPFLKKKDSCIRMKNTKFFSRMKTKKFLFLIEKQKNVFAGKKTWLKRFESLKEKPIVIVVFLERLTVNMYRSLEDNAE